MAYPYQTKTREQDGRHYLVEWFHDDDTLAPWTEHDGHGIVTDWERRDKRAGELILVAHHHAKLFYDFQATIQQARKEGWGIANPAPGMTPRQIIAEAVRLDFEYLRAWCNDEWWCGVVVTLLDPETDPEDEVVTDLSASLWGIASNAPDDYFYAVIQDLIREIAVQESREAFPVACCAI